MTEGTPAGLVERRRNRRTGHVVALYLADRAGLDPEGGPWVTLCETHGNLCNHETRSMARSFLSAPWEWCEACAQEVGVVQWSCQREDPRRTSASGP